MKVWFIPLSAIDYDDPYWHEHVDHYVEDGELTTDHPASSYGAPVIVRDSDGVAHGPGDCYGGGYAGRMKEPRNHVLEAAAAAAGWERESNYGETAETY